ncbi:hypothetical protein [Granulosicoccus antarcticus]|uniref:MxaA protein n=1 Tax=Granulosicoccus antarcticus IMCC3135 TaxID=1192854 RepID=A0A2Z2NRP4_9GAMM|nr:hypothetical protein [Granulosicoccus antarcticus]ASJ70207.1 hypothetical protein IMCC3135_00405 [Granulosicoccus antarcticus IMCC3135]
MTSCRCLRAALLPLMMFLPSAGPTLAAGDALSKSEPGDPTALTEPQPAPYLASSIVPTRSFGFVVGDVLLQNIALPDGYHETELTELSDTTRISTWLERQDAVIKAVSDDRHILTVRYQIVNSPTTIIKAALPELSLAPSPGGQQADRLVAAWPFTLGPITIGTALIEDQALADTLPMVNGVPLQADMTLPALDEATPAARLRLALWLLALSLAAWASWYLWRHQRDKVRLPFTQALHQLKSGKQSTLDEPDRPWKTLHRAFNQSAGQVVNTTSLDTLFDSHSWLRPLEDRIRAFYEASAARHFALPPRDEPFAIEELASALAHCEISNSR